MPNIIKRIKTLERWTELEENFLFRGYRLWQWQYNVQHANGFHAWFCATDKQDVEVITYNQDVLNAIIDYPRKQKDNRPSVKT